MTPTPAYGHGKSDQGWCSVNTVDGCAVVTAGGRFDVQDHGKFHDTLTVAGAFSKRIVVDVTAVRSMEPAAFGMLIGRLLRSRKDSMTLCLVGPPAGVHQRVDTTLLAKYFDSYPSVDDAVAALQ
jgi:anti-anti-sigma factor